jgi:TorA maturation chaperone TorD
LNREAVLNRDHVSDVDSLRANVYRLMARALSRPVDRPFLDLLAGLSGDDTDIGRAFGDLAETASATSLEAAREEYQNLFIGLGRGEILPYASYYLTGFLNEKPLARLRNDMVPLGIERDPSVKEPEDHAGALMDMMAGLIEGSFGADQPMTVQKEFFQKHLFNWMPHLYRDIQRANSARLYKPLGRVGEVFMEIEKAAFDM